MQLSDAAARETFLIIFFTSYYLTQSSSIHFTPGRRISKNGRMSVKDMIQCQVNPERGPGFTPEQFGQSTHAPFLGGDTPSAFSFT